jgi:hypothetical protein
MERRRPFLPRAPIEHDRPPNDRLFRYFPLNTSERETWVRDIFINHELYFASPTSFNDPFDGKLPPLETLSKDARRHFIEKFVRERMIPASRNKFVRERMIPASRNERRILKRELSSREVFAEAGRRFQEIVDATGLLCMAERNDDILMWSHYADSHKGICLEFEATSNTQLFCEAVPVKYADTYTAFPLLGGGREWVNRVLLTKSSHWKYEKEWRITRHGIVIGGVSLVTRNVRLNRFSPNALRGVIFGCQCSADTVKKVTSWIHEGGCQVTRYHARRKLREYGLEIEQIS